MLAKTRHNAHVNIQQNAQVADSRGVEALRDQIAQLLMSFTVHPLPKKAGHCDGRTNLEMMHRVTIECGRVALHAMAPGSVSHPPIPSPVAGSNSETRTCNVQRKPSDPNLSNLNIGGSELAVRPKYHSWGDVPGTPGTWAERGQGGGGAIPEPNLWISRMNCMQALHAPTDNMISPKIRWGLN